MSEEKYPDVTRAQTKTLLFGCSLKRFEYEKEQQDN